MIFQEFSFHPIHKFIHRKYPSFFIAFVFFARPYSSSQSSLILIASGTSSVTGIISLMILKQSANSSAGTPNSRTTLFPSSIVTLKIRLIFIRDRIGCYSQFIVISIIYRAKSRCAFYNNFLCFHALSPHIHSTACNRPKWSSCLIGCQPFPFSKIHSKIRNI